MSERLEEMAGRDAPHSRPPEVEADTAERVIRRPPGGRPSRA